MDVLRIGGACAFWGDSALGIDQLLASDAVDVLVFDYLAELTMSLLARARAKDPGAGYATDFVSGVAPHLPTIARKKIKLLSNAGGIHPQACARALQAAAEAAGVQLNIVVVEGDDLLPQVDAIRAAGVREMFSGAPLPERLTSMNAYLGAGPIARALALGADVVITGRCVDSALALGALMHHFGWTPQEHDKLAAGSLVGHLLECTTQTTGGLYTDWLDIPDGPDGADIGYPIAECRANGEFVLTKPAGTGGRVAPLVAAEQMLYEIADPGAYMLPDVCCDFTGVRLEHAGADRVLVSGARGAAPSDSYKVSATWHDGYRISSTLTIVGEDAVAKAGRVGEAILARTRRMFVRDGIVDYDETLIEVLGSEVPSYGAQARGQQSREVVLRVTCKHASAAALGMLAREFAPFGTAGAPGTTGFSGRPKPQPVFRLHSFLWRKAALVQRLSGESIESCEVPPPDPGAGAPHRPARYESVAPASGVSRRVRLSELAVARSGDKGDSVNIAVIAREPRFVAPIARALTPERVADVFSHLVRGAVTRYDVPGVGGFNFVLQQALGGGGAASLRNDPLGKAFAQILLAVELDAPAE